ncbi:GatB/YqeY domain-containing protein [Guyanagaster necrorhizus]|uniref:Altered inheritance of mitochondria protein 41 n=1 Tax=Guyanagaster necrorhizus TaxID=856835 RepID=A0A9P8ASL2_9AGAR|nr:GatB/YqeY domain-containing protein [Guyanagaster necrorhizus MCA 3950]KAG7446449.1 GatB/YqeY domain-containing protein [Guyanagaster necrorhizus MCA 3950]
MPMASFYAARFFLQRPLLRLYTTTVHPPTIREQLTAGVKNALKNKDPFTSTLLRSVLSEVYAADKAKGPVSQSTIVSIMRKAVARRNEAIDQYTKANRQDLVDKESKEATALAAFLPPLLSEAEIDTRLRAAIEAEGISADNDPRKSAGKIMKAFYAAVDKSGVDTPLVKQRLDILLPQK